MEEAIREIVSRNESGERDAFHTIALSQNDAFRFTTENDFASAIEFLTEMNERTKPSNADMQTVLEIIEKLPSVEEQQPTNLENIMTSKVAAQSFYDRHVMGVTLENVRERRDAIQQERENIRLRSQILDLAESKILDVIPARLIRSAAISYLENKLVEFQNNFGNDYEVEDDGLSRSLSQSYD